MSDLTPAELGFDYQRLDLLRARYQRGVADHEIPGAHIVITRAGQTVFDETFGYADPVSKEPMTRSTIFPLASMTKPVVSVAAMILVERGLLHLDDPVSRHLPELAEPQVVVPATGDGDSSALTLVPADREPTVQDLLCHTAGYTYGPFGTTLAHRMWDDVMDLNDLNHSDLRELVARVGQVPLLHQPGTTWEYSVATDVLGALVERLTHQQLDEFIDENLCTPLQLSTLRFNVSASDTLARSFPSAESALIDAWSSGGPIDTPSLLAGGVGLYATAGDYAKFAQMLLNGGELNGVRILSPKTVQYMTADHLRPDTIVPGYMAKLQKLMAPTPAMGQGFGLGFAVRTSVGRNPAPGSVGEFYWAGGSGTYFWVDPQEKIVVVAATVQPQTDIKIRYRQLARQLVYQALVQSNPPLNPAPPERTSRNAAAAFHPKKPGPVALAKTSLHP